MQPEKNISEIDETIQRFFTIESVVYGDSSRPFISQYQGKIIHHDISDGFNQITEALGQFGLIAILQQEGSRHKITILSKRTHRSKKKPRLNLIMFILTLFSVLFTGGIYAYQGELPQNTWHMITALVGSGWPFAISLLAILSAHEFGHYFMGKSKGVDVTLPFFIPFPFSSFGTMGAFINMRSLPRNRKDLFDIAIAGPLSGLVISIIVLIIGLNLSTLSTLPISPEAGVGLQMEGNSLLYLLIKFLTFGKLLPKPQAIEGISNFIYWVRYFFTGVPFPWGAEDVLLHPVAWAGWAGFFVTSINLLPVGQLDGGHIFQTVFGKKASIFIFPLIITGLGILGFFWNGWWMWAGILFFMGRRYAEPLNQITMLNSTRKWLGYLAILIFLVTFIPVPIIIIGF